jgi:hypothetical protein
LQWTGRALRVQGLQSYARLPSRSRPATEARALDGFVLAS